MATNSTTFTINIKAVSDMKDVLTNVNNIKTALSKVRLNPKLDTEFKDIFKEIEKEINNY